MGSCHFNLQRIQAYRSEEPGRTGIDGGVCPVLYPDDRPPFCPPFSSPRTPYLYPPYYPPVPPPSPERM